MFVYNSLWEGGLDSVFGLSSECLALKNCVTFVFGVFCPECWALVTSQWPCEIWQPQESEQYKTQTHPNTQVKHIDANNYMELMMERDLQYSDSLDVMLMFSFDENLNTCWCWCTVAVQILTFGEETSKSARLAFALCWLPMFQLQCCITRGREIYRHDI